MPTQTHIKPQTYKNYKSSGVEWLGDIPEHWEVESFKHILTERNLKNTLVLSKERLSLSIEAGVTLYADKTTNLDRFKDDFSQYKLAYENDLVFNSMNMIVGAVGVSKYFGCVSPVYYTYYSGRDNDSSTKFYEYLFRSRLIKGVLYSLGKGLIAIDRGDGKYNTLRLKVSREDLRSLKLPLPKFEEQCEIVNFLDDKTQKIDQAIAIKVKQINLLKERKQIIIHKLVTGQLVKNGDAWTEPTEVKDSGVEWIGEIPKHWEVKNLRYAFEFLNNRRIPLSALEREKMQGNYPYYGASGVIDYVDDYIFDEKLVLIGEDGANLLSKSTPLAFVADGQYWVNNHAHILRPKFKGFLYWAEQLSLIDYTVYISGAAQPKLSRGNLGSVKVLVPSNHDLEQISTYIESTSQKIESAISIKQQEIAQLKEYKSSLINSVVTGKVRVC